MNIQIVEGYEEVLDLVKGIEIEWAFITLVPGTTDVTETRKNVIQNVVVNHERQQKGSKYRKKENWTLNWREGHWWP